MVALTTTSDPPGRPRVGLRPAAMAAAVGVSASSVQRIWRAHGLQPHRVRSFDFLRRPRCREAARHRRAVRRPAGGTMVLGATEKPEVTLRPDAAGPGSRAAGDDDARLSARRDHHPVRRPQRPRRLRDRAVHAASPPPNHPLPQPESSATSRRRAVMWIADNYATHQRPKVDAWLDRHPRWTFHFATSSSWLNAVEGFFAKLTDRPAETRHVHLDRRPAGHHQPLRRRHQPDPAIRLDRQYRPRSSPAVTMGTKHFGILITKDHRGQVSVPCRK